LVSAIISIGSVATSPEPQHFFTQDSCQSWELKDENDGLIQTIWYLRRTAGIQVKQGYIKNSENTFFQSWNLIEDSRTQINQYPNNIILCQTHNLTTEEKDAIVIRGKKWEQMKNNPKLVSNKNGKSKWIMDGTAFLGENYTEVEYTEKNGLPSKFTFYDDLGRIVKELSVTNFESDCSIVGKEFTDDIMKCERSAKLGNNFEDNTSGKRGASSVRISSKQFDLSDTRFAAQKKRFEAQKNSERSKEDRCSATAAWDALMRAVTTKSMEYGNWCGVGGEKGVCCDEVCPDGGYDVLCRKHDSSTYWESIMGVTVSPCACDIDFIESSKQFDGCIGNATAPWRVDPDPTGAVTCEETKQAAINTFLCMPCLNFECEHSFWDFSNWGLMTECSWVSYWGRDPEYYACDGDCWDESKKPWGYEHWYDVPCN